jgi:TPR repeat protein
VRLADLQFEGRGVAQNTTLAVEAYEKFCEAGVLEACVGYARANEQGGGVPRNLPRAAALYEATCHNGSQTGCAHLGTSGPCTSPDAAHGKTPLVGCS